uniref:Putative splicing factor U2af small subunit B-like n=1 Tax=Davidia involucrata TaxID=16924 RepID=A0A5B6YGG0_DAVIN
MIGNVYVQFKEEEQAAAALQALQGRFYSGRPIIADFSPVTDFREATCRQFEENNCNRGGYCNFMHVKLIGRDLRRKLFGITGGTMIIGVEIIGTARITEAMDDGAGIGMGGMTLMADGGEMGVR